MNRSCIVLAGPPNSGKTTLFNWLTGYKAHVVNYPGSTIDYSRGRALKKYDLPADIVDTPGIYSLFPKNPSEQIAVKILYEFPIQCVVVTADIFRLRRQLPLALQLKEAGFPVVIAMTMCDLIVSSEIPDFDLFTKETGIRVVPVEGPLGKGVSTLVNEIKKETIVVSEKLKFKEPGAWLADMRDQIFQKTDSIVSKIFSHIKASKSTQKIDRFLLNPVFGMMSFLAIMITLFSSIFWLAAPAMDLVDQGFSWLAEMVQRYEADLLTDFLSNGVITSFAAVFVFVPQIFILFAGICILEDSGYLARAASLMDALFSKIGLSGRSFIPFLSGYACAIPACLAARNITSRKERLIVIAVIPLLTCSARLPVYSLLLSLFFYNDSAWKPGMWMAVIYLSSMALGGLAAYVIHSFVGRKNPPPFVMELPSYKRPMILGVLSSAWRRTKHYVKGAGPLIFLFALLIWGSTHFPRNLDLDEGAQIENSYAGKFGKTIEPVFELMGGDWRVGVGLLSAFVAREVFVSTLAALFQITQESAEDETIQHSLLKKMKKAKNSKGELVFTPVSVLALILFFMISLQCLSTTAVVQRETGSSFFALAQLAVLNVLAYVLCVGVYQISQIVF